MAAEKESGELLGCDLAFELFAVHASTAPHAGAFGSVGEVRHRTVHTLAGLGGASEVVDDGCDSTSGAGSCGAERGDVEDRHHDHRAVGWYVCVLPTWKVFATSNADAPKNSEISRPTPEETEGYHLYT